ncbi:unnamed protein product [Ambrosiozyma monospora]|uniref:Unnamed protein product n=1 Tax=Ambrosiozyma monospora TaxID=43982 RepID=A0ACB5U7F9_AMBMO|nr:unnamed protein product [Ambrosiozyma monospora]
MKKTKTAFRSLQHGRIHPSRNAVIAKKNPVNAKKKAEELMRLRLSVDMNPLYRNVLTWSYTKSGDFPVDGDRKFSAVGNTFSSAAEYQATFEPLLLLECWQGIQRAKQIGDNTPFKISIGSRAATDSFFDVYASVKKDIVNEMRLVNDNDLVALLLTETLPDGDKLTQRHIQNPKASCFAKVREIKTNAGGYADITLRVATSTPLISCLSPGCELALL